MNIEILTATAAPLVMMGDIVAAAAMSKEYNDARESWRNGDSFRINRPQGQSLEEIRTRYNVCREVLNIAECLTEDHGGTVDQIVDEEVVEEVEALKKFFDAVGEDADKPGHYEDRYVYDRDAFEDHVAELVRCEANFDMYHPPAILWGAIDTDAVVDSYARDADGCVEFELNGTTYYLA